MNAIFILALVTTLWSYIHCKVLFVNPELNMSPIQIITHYGYPSETHTVTTDDGYILTMFRIPYGKKSPAGSSKPVVFLQHGLLDSSFTWICNDPTQSLGYILADLGYDVWLGNTRGNTYSRSHISFSDQSNAFWDFTWNDMASLDLPAMINYALKVANMPKLTYIGHSQGTEIGFAKFSENSPLNAKVSSFVALAPVAYLGHVKTAIVHVSVLGGLIDLGTQLLNHGEFLPTNDMVNKLTNLVCGNSGTVIVCSNLLFLFAGYNIGNLNETRIPIYISHIPAGTSSKNVNHYAQSYLSNKFQKYDYGFFLNRIKYGSFSPPTYELNTYGVPVGMFYGGNDWLATPIDVTRTINELGSSVKLVSYLPNYNHLDYVWGITANNDVYKPVVEFMRKYQ